MASKLIHKHQEEEPMHFFRIITTSSLQEGKLMIPTKVVEKYGEGFPNTLILKTPNGAKLELGLKKRDDKIWFQKGWKEFAESHSLVHGHLLLFRHQRTSHLEVHIFDSSALEIDYPLQEVASNENGNKPLNDQNFEYHRQGQKRKDNSSLKFLHPCMGSGSHKCAKVDNTMKLSKASRSRTNKKSKGKQMTATTQEAFDRASCFKSCNPSFTIIMCSSYVRCRGPLYIPCKFSREHIHDLHKNERGDINLQLLSGRVWPARYVIRTFREKIRVELSTGWRRFAEDNNLKVGDVCIFEFITGSKLTFQIHIFRDSDHSMTEKRNEA